MSCTLWTKISHQYIKTAQTYLEYYKGQQCAWINIDRVSVVIKPYLYWDICWLLVQPIDVGCWLLVQPIDVSYNRALTNDRTSVYLLKYVHCTSIIKINYPRQMMHLIHFQIYNNNNYVPSDKLQIITSFWCYALYTVFVCVQKCHHFKMVIIIMFCFSVIYR